jgi:hypothetical protein
MAGGSGGAFITRPPDLSPNSQDVANTLAELIIGGSLVRGGSPGRVPVPGADHQPRRAAGELDAAPSPETVCHRGLWLD